MASRETQNKVLDKAISLFNAEGTDRVSCNRITEECKISKGNLHYHFKHKEEIILAIWGRMSQEIETQWGEDAPQPTNQRSPDEDDALKSLLRIAWIVTEHWMSSIAIEDKLIDATTMQEGFRLTLQVFMPLLYGQQIKSTGSI